MTEAENRAAQNTDEIRRVLAEGFAFVRGAEVTESVSAASFEHILVRAIQDIEGDDTDIRPGKLSKVRSLKARVLDAIDRAQEMPADMFELRDSGANTREDGTGAGESEE